MDKHSEQAEPSRGERVKPPKSPPAVPNPALGTFSVLNMLQDLLGASSADTVLPNPDDSESAPTPSTPNSSPSKKYQVANEIGKGGMGAVMKAYDVDLHRWVAMKVVRGDTTKKCLPSDAGNPSEHCRSRELGRVAIPNDDPKSDQGLV